jgi:hypothetical protein
MLQVLAATVLLSGLLTAVGLWALLSAAAHLKDLGPEPRDVGAGRTSRPVAAFLRHTPGAADRSPRHGGIGRRRSVLRGGSTAHPRGPARLSGRDRLSADTAAETS